MASRGEQVMERINKLPLQVKILIIAAVPVLLTAGNWYFFWSDEKASFDSSVKEMTTLEDTIIQNQQIANNLGQYKKQKEALQLQLDKALTELPEVADIEGLIDSLNEMGTKANLAINSIDPRAETRGPDGLYAEIPIAMTVTGSYLDIAVFFDSVRQLKRIVDIANIKVNHPHFKADRVLVDASYTATTYRFLPQETKGGKDKDKDKSDKDKSAVKEKGGDKK